MTLARRSVSPVRQPCDRRGLTVIELVSALALFVLVLGTLLIALNTATDLWTSSSSKNRAQLQARRALDLIATDLCAAVAEPELRPDGTRPPEAPSPSSADYPLFMVRNDGANQLGLVFIRQRSPAEMSGVDALSLELVAYCFNRTTTNGLARYTRPAAAPRQGAMPQSLSAQLQTFWRDVSKLSAPTNFLAPCVSDFRPLVYKSLDRTTQTTEAEPPKPLGYSNRSADNIRLADLPDFVDIHIGFVDWDAASLDIGRTNYFVRRITLPAAHASRLP